MKCTLELILKLVMIFVLCFNNVYETKIVQYHPNFGYLPFVIPFPLSLAPFLFFTLEARTRSCKLKFN